MSDAAITSIVTGLVTIATILASSFALWLKVKYGVEKAGRVEEKVDYNTAVTTQAAEAAAKLGEHTGTCTKQIEDLTSTVLDHHARISALESQMASLKASIDVNTKTIDSTRHEMRGHLQTVVNKLDLLSMAKLAKDGA